MSSNGLPHDRFSSDRRQADNAVRVMLDFIMSNLQHLRKVDNHGKMERAAKSFLCLLKNGEYISPGSRAYIEGIYEACMRGAGFESVPLHTDKKRKSLKFG